MDKNKVKLFTNARVRAGLCRNQAAEYLGLSIQNFTLAEQSGEIEDEWIEKLKELHTGVAVGPESEQTPEEVRRLRVLAGMTKPEASRCIGLKTPGGWHAYESGRSRMSDESWRKFRQALSSGSFRMHLTSAYRRGPRLNTSFVPGRFSRASHHDPFVPQGGELLTRARSTLRMSASHFSKVVGANIAQIYKIESGSTYPRESHIRHFLTKTREALQSHPEEVKILNGTDILQWLRNLRVQAIEMPRYASYGRRYKSSPLPDQIAQDVSARFRRIRDKTLEDMRRLADEGEELLKERV